MSFVILEGSLYFQTDKEMRKYQDIKGNPNVTLCFSNIQLEGICEEIGRPIEHETFADCFNNIFHRPLKPIASFQMKGYL